MRLLQLKNDGKVVLTEELTDQIPPFAILSHTWAVENDEEVTFRDIIQDHGDQKAGYKKLRFCGEQAKRDHLQYFWVDTCCIDKSSSTELAEAINSMFRWYHEAVRCYVLLTDVSKNALETFAKPDLLSWKSEFLKSRWFTRGWTLQELVAPRSVDFFSGNGCLLGNRRSLEREVHDITGISVDVLRGERSLQDCSVRERMEWTKGRVTRRPEDSAYSLFGIFDVYMPLIYGEGRERALARLRRQIDESHSLPQNPSEDDPDPDRPLGNPTSLDRSKTFTASFSDAPVDLLPTCFVGRQRELGMIKSAHQIQKDNLPIRCTVWGIPGVGKTQLAIRYTKLFLNSPEVSAVFWTSCSNVEKAYQGFSRILSLVNHPDQFKLEQDARIVAARRWLEQPEGCGVVRWLLVLDNVDVTTLDFLRENLPRQSKHGHILLTTRTEAVAQAVCRVSGTLQQCFELEPLAMDDAVTLFLNSAKVDENSVSSTSRSQVVGLLQCLGCLPFAIEHAASFMTQSSQTVDNFTRLYQSDQKSYILNWQNLVSSYESKSIAGMFDDHLRFLKQSKPDVYNLLNILVFWDPDSIDFQSIKAGALFLGTPSEKMARPADSNHAWNWTRWSIPSLLKAWYQGLNLNHSELVVNASRSDLDDHVLPSSELEPLIQTMSSEVRLHSALQQLQMLSFVKRRSSLDGGSYRIHDLTQTLLQVALESEDKNLHWFECAVRMACGALRQIRNPSLPENWHSYENLIAHILSLAKYGDKKGHSNIDLLKARGNIARYWRNRGRYREALEVYEQLLSIDSDILHSAGIGVNHWKISLAEVNWDLCRHKESALLYEEVLQNQKLSHDGSHPDILNTEEKLALVYRSQARHAEARTMLEHILECQIARFGADHLDTVRTIDNLAMTINECAEVDNDMVQFAEAERLHKQAWTCRVAQLGRNHLDTLWTADGLGTNYRAQGRYTEAVEIYQEVLEGRISQLGKDHPHVLWTVANIASAYTSLSRFAEAEAMYKHAIAGNETRLSPDHSETLWSVEGLADICLKQSKLKEARDLYNRALQGLSTRLGPEHPSVARLQQKLTKAESHPI